MVLNLPLCLCYGKELLGDKQCAYLKHCSQEKGPRELKGQFHRFLSFRRVCNAVVGIKHQYL